jgi:phosphoribosylformylglycinamidine (FGAM) synthase-like amidotransferase family enzyme
VKFGVIVFPGSNCDHDAYHVISKHVGQPVDFIWHRDTDLSTYDAVIIPGGFSYGDYLRATTVKYFRLPISAQLFPKWPADLSIQPITFESPQGKTLYE